MQFKQIPLNDYESKLHARAIRTARVFTRCEPKLVTIVEEVDRLRLFEKFGQVNTFNYCLKELKLTKALSYSFQAVARKTREVPELLQAMQSGMSVSTANKLVAQINPDNQAMWIAKAKTLTQSDLEFELAAANPKKRRATKKDPVDRTHSRMSIDIANSTLALLVRGVEILEKDEATVLHIALETLLEKIDPVRKADRMLKRKRHSAEAERAGTEDSAEAERLAAESTAAEYALAEGSASAKNLASLANRVPFNAQTYHKVNARDRGQCQEILSDGKRCGSSRWVEIHHMIPRSKGGSNATANLITLCSSHHRIHHRRSWVESPVVAYSA